MILIELLNGIRNRLDNDIPIQLLIVSNRRADGELCWT
jgi:hypothetical protein